LIRTSTNEKERIEEKKSRISNNKKGIKRRSTLHSFDQLGVRDTVTNEKIIFLIRTAGGR
jgi:uncharacterized protein (UPF0335 family)